MELQKVLPNSETLWGNESKPELRKGQNTRERFQQLSLGRDLLGRALAIFIPAKFSSFSPRYCSPGSPCGTNNEPVGTITYVQIVLGWSFDTLKMKGRGCSEGRRFHCHCTDGEGEESVGRDICPGSHSAAVQGRDCHTIPKLFFFLFSDLAFWVLAVFPTFVTGCELLRAGNALLVRSHCGHRQDHRYRHIQAILKLPHSPLWHEVRGALTAKVCWRKRHRVSDKVTNSA